MEQWRHRYWHDHRLDIGDVLPPGQFDYRHVAPVSIFNGCPPHAGIERLLYSGKFRRHPDWRQYLSRHHGVHTGQLLHRCPGHHLERHRDRGMLGISSGNTINLIAPGTGGSASNWSSFTTANVPNQSAGYFLIQIAGVNYRVPIYANG